jgi:hypothetical protein
VSFSVAGHIKIQITEERMKVHFNLKNAADVSEEHRFKQDLHGATSQKTAFFTVTAVKTSNLASF